MSRSITPLCMDTGYKTLREYLHASRLTEVEVPQDGLCILHAVHGGLQSSHTSTSAQGLSKKNVKDMVRDEFLQHVDEYMPYSALSEEDTLAQLESWAQTGQYGSDSVDLILHILSQVLNLRIVVVEETTSRVTSLDLLPHRQEECSLIQPITSVILIKHGQHFNHTVFSRDKERCPSKKEITYTSTTEPIIISSNDSDDEWYLAREGPTSPTK
ncbi:uncharacterized protein LOC119720281 [Patiria miniata]|uniref:OTU domain-containing protein n=1 Tax=Patiria miniata TaxID=46514 RepID=A0A913Z4D2_PATMI|nr:uncharacterized protein LOC119720281 [Patiria miniata]